MTARTKFLIHMAASMLFCGPIMFAIHPAFGFFGTVAMLSALEVLYGLWDDLFGALNTSPPIGKENEGNRT